jgi:hypothetical protein
MNHFTQSAITPHIHILLVLIQLKSTKNVLLFIIKYTVQMNKVFVKAQRLCITAHYLKQNVRKHFCILGTQTVGKFCT